MSVTTTREIAHGLLRLEEDRLVIQWRLARTTEVVGNVIRTDREVDPVQEVVVPLSGLAGAFVQRGWIRFLTGPRLVLTAADLVAFEDMAGEAGLKLDHPAEIVLRIRRSDVLAAEEFAAELALALAQRSLGDGDSPPALPEGDSVPRLGG
jgi:hypothetical protein